MRAPLLPVLLVFAIAACTGSPKPHYVKQGVSEDQARLDQLDCRRFAEDRAGAQFERDTAPLPGRQGLDPTLSRDFARIDAERYAQKLMESCLGLRGYRRVDP